MMSDLPAPELNYRVITFYSYKGGVGRSMALANVAALLAQKDRRVLVVDFDLEAPGLHYYFDHSFIRSRKRSSRGLVDLFDNFRRGERLDWRRCITPIRWSEASLDLLPAGGAGGDYAELVQGLNWELLIKERGLGDYLSELREEWRSEYDVVLIDSRTGMSDIGGICTIILPDAVVMLFTANQQSIVGTAEVVRRARVVRDTLPVERGRLLAIPMLSRDDRRTEYEQSERWRERVAEAMEDFFADWVLEGIPAAAVLQQLYLPQIAYWSFGERLPVLERPHEISDPSSIGAAYDRLARLIDADFDWSVIGGDISTGAIDTLKARYERVLRLKTRILLIMLAVIILGATALLAYYLLVMRPQAAEQARQAALASEMRAGEDQALRNQPNESRPSCLPATEPIMTVDFQSDGSFWTNPTNAEQFGVQMDGVPGAIVFANSRTFTSVDFARFAGQVRDWGLRQPNSCVFRVRVFASHSDLSLFVQQVRIVQRYFYTVR